MFVPRPDEELNVFACHKSNNVSSAKSPEKYPQLSDEIFFFFAANRVEQNVAHFVFHIKKTNA